MKKQKFLIYAEFLYHSSYDAIEAETLDDAWLKAKDTITPADMRQLKQARGVAIDDMTEITP